MCPPYRECEQGKKISYFYMLLVSIRKILGLKFNRGGFLSCSYNTCNTHTLLDYDIQC